MRRAGSAFALALAVRASSAAAAAPSAAPARMVMPWLCMQDCGFSAAQIAAQVAELAAAPRVFSHASPEAFDLCANGTACRKTPRSDVSRALADAGLGVHAMIVSWNLDDIRAAFAAPAAFAASVDAALRAHAPAATGINVDFEPHGSNPPLGPEPTAADAAAFAAFLDAFAGAMHARDPPLEVSVDVATWSPFWDFAAINATRVDFVVDMESCAHRRHAPRRASRR